MVNPPDRCAPREWHELTRLTQGAAMVVERVRILDSGIVIEGPFIPPQLAQLGLEDQIFVAAFVRAHGSIKEMEQVFGVSYPTIKSRLNRIAQKLEFVDTNPGPSRRDVLNRLRRGELTVEEAVSALEAMP
jgi:hypothetical protein